MLVRNEHYNLLATYTFLHCMLSIQTDSLQLFHTCLIPHCWYYHRLTLHWTAQRHFTFVPYTSAGLHTKVILQSCLLLRCKLVSVNNLPNSTTPHLTPLTLLETSASYSMNTSPFLTRSHLSQKNLALTIFVSFGVSVHASIPKQLPPSPLLLFTPSWTTATLFIATCPSLRSPGSTDLEHSC